MEIIQLPSYQISLGSIEKSLSTFLTTRKYHKIAILCDENTRDYCLPKIINSISDDAKIICLPSGEQHKNIDSCIEIWSALVEHQFSRHDLMINLGGGVIGDMGGYAASCFMRGMDFIQIPTSLLAQVDASVGGKLAIDFMGFKNMIGLFQDPQAVLIDPRFLNTISEVELLSGYAEMIKHGLINDTSIWAAMTKHKNWKGFISTDSIAESVMVKKHIVEQDPHERGLRKILNFGHTIGHAIESYSYDIGAPLTHGAAVAYGMIAEAYLATQKTGLSSQHFTQIEEYIISLYGPPQTSYFSQIDRLILRMKGDKKNKADAINFSLLGGIGICYFNIVISEEEITKALSYMKGLS